MVTLTTQVKCPICEESDYEIIKLELIDTDLHATYHCPNCGTEYTDVYALIYIGGTVQGM